MQFKGYHINNLKSYRKYFCFSDAAEAFENGAYQEWLTGILKMPEYEETAAGEAARVIKNIQSVLGQISERENREQKSATENLSARKRYEKLYQRLFMLFFELAQVPVTKEDRKEIARAVRAEAEKRIEAKTIGTEKTDSGAEILLSGDDYEIQVWRNKSGEEKGLRESHLLFRWKKLINRGTMPLSILLMDGERALTYRCLDPGGYVWLLTLNGRFVKWGSRVRTHYRSFACVDRKGCLTVNGYPMRSAGMIDFAFDQRTGILGVDANGNLRQYSGLNLEMSVKNAIKSDTLEKEKIAFACLNGKTYILVKENGELITNLTDCPADFFGWQAEKAQAAKGEIMISAGAADLPFPAFTVSVSEQLIGFETPDSRIGVWDRERKQLLWMEGTE